MSDKLYKIMTIDGFLKGQRFERDTLDNKINFLISRDKREFTVAEQFCCYEWQGVDSDGTQLYSCEMKSMSPIEEIPLCLDYWHRINNPDYRNIQVNGGFGSIDGVQVDRFKR